MIILANEHIRMTVSETGAEPVSLLYHGRERLWQNENGSWAGHAPVLFPVAGNCHMRVEGKNYPLGRHGFARRKRFCVLNAASDTATFRLLSDAETQAVYPFAFVLDVTYALRGNSLEICYEVQNPAEAPLYFACGGHLSHALFGPAGEHLLIFPEEEVFLSHEHDDDGLLTGQTSDMGWGKTLTLSDDFYHDGKTLILCGLRSRSVTLVSRSVGPLAEVSFAGFGNLLLWRPEGARMLCIEPWSNLPDRAGEEREFKEKEGVFAVLPGERKRCLYTVTYF